MSLKKTKATAFEGGRFAVLLAVGELKEPPTELLMFGKGTTPTTKGPVVYDAEAAKAVKAAFADQGLDLLPFDVGHGMLNPFAGPDAHKAVGWFTPEARPDGLYAANIQWTDYGRAALMSREFRYYSPAIMRHEETGRVLEVINCALTNLPATKGQKPLVADRVNDDADQPKGKTVDIELFLKLLGARTTDEVVARYAQISQLLALTGCASLDLALTEVARLKSAAAEAVNLASRLTAIEAERETEKRAAKIAELSLAGKLPPSLHAWAGTVTLAQLEAYGAAAPVVTKPQVKESPEAPSVTTLSAEESEVAKQLGLTVEQYLDAKKKYAPARAS